jgi:zinc transporter ZupT
MEIILGLLAGGLLGMLGQSIRAGVGIKKMLDKGKYLFEWRILVVSLFIGFVAGVLAWAGIYMVGGSLATNILGVIAAGYAGTDAIEGFLPKNA